MVEVPVVDDDDRVDHQAQHRTTWHDQKMTTSRVELNWRNGGTRYDASTTLTTRNSRKSARIFATFARVASTAVFGGMPPVLRCLLGVLPGPDAALGHGLPRDRPSAMPPTAALWGAPTNAPSDQQGEFGHRIK